MNKKYFQSEAGISGLVVMVLTLPIAIMLTAGVIDLTRSPIAHDRLQDALFTAAYGVEKAMAENSPGKVLDPFTPAGNNFCNYTVPGGDCEISALGERAGFVSDGIAQLMVDEACELARQQLTTRLAGIFTYGNSDQELAIQFAVIYRGVGTASGGANGGGPIVYSADTCGGASFASFSDHLMMNAIGTHLVRGFSPAEPGAGAWYIQDDSHNTTYVSDRAPYLPSYWLAGIAHLRIKRYLGSTFGRTNVVTEYFVRPLNVPLGIQTGAASGS